MHLNIEDLLDPLRVKVQMEELRAELCALVACLEESGILSEETFRVQVQKQNFEKMRSKHPLKLELSIIDVLSSRSNTPSHLARFLNIKDIGSVMASSRPTWHAFDIGGISTARGAMRLYVCGGSDEQQSALTTVESFNVMSGRWQTIGPMSEPRSRGVAAVLGESLYVCGGGSKLNSVECLNVITGEWTPAPHTLHSRLGAAGATRDGYIYLCGGNDHARTLTSVERFKPANGRWEFVEPMQQPRAYASAAVVGDDLYVCGGVYRGLPSNTSECLPCFGQAWENRSRMLHSRAYHASAPLLDCIYVCGGQGEGESQPLSSVEMYDLVAGLWLPAQFMCLPRLMPVAAGFRGRLYVCGGYVNGLASNTMERYDPSTGQWQIVPSMAHPRGFAAGGMFVGYV